MNSSDLKPREALANGRMSHVMIDTGAVQNTFLHVTSAQRASGLIDYAKIWWHVADTNNDTLLDPETYLDKPTKSLDDDDYVVKWLSDPRTANSQAALEAEAATADKYGSAYVAEDIIAGAHVIDINFKHANLQPGGIDEIIRAADKIKLCSHSDALATDGTEETLTVNGALSQVDGLKWRITTVEAIANSYMADGTTVRVSSLIPLPDTKPSVENLVVTTAGDGDYDFVANPLVLDNLGTPEEDFEILFDDAANFSMTGDTIPDMGSGDKNTDFSPNNPNFTRPYLTLKFAGFSGTWAAGDKITGTLHPAGVPLGEKRFIKAGARSLSNNMVASVYGGEAN